MGRRRRPFAHVTEEFVLARLAGADEESAARALRRHEVWRQAVDDGSSRQSKRALRRAWERARDEALIALSVAEAPTEDDRPKHSQAGRLARAAGGRG
jgi:hypothetical protein